MQAELSVNQSIHFYVMIYVRNLREELKCEADPNFNRVPRERRKKSVVKSCASTEAVSIGSEGQPGNNNEIQSFRAPSRDGLADAKLPGRKIRERGDRAKP